MTNDAHHDEYLGAVAGFRESNGWNDTTNTPPTLAIGDFISGKTAGKQWSGHIEWFSDDASIVVNVGGAWVRVPAADVTF
jgi:hypothetical protein